MAAIPYLALHIALGAAAVLCSLRFAANRSAANLWAVVVLAGVFAGLLVERRSSLAWSAMQIGWPNRVFVINQALAGSLAVAALAIRSAPDSRSRARAVVPGTIVVGAGLWSYAWLWSPMPQGLTGRADKSGFCGQTSDASCAAAAAVMLLHAFGVETTEREMAGLCLTRAREGTTPLGLFRGVAEAASRRGLEPKVLRTDGVRALPCPCLIEVGLKPGLPRGVARRLEGYGWELGVRHAVFVSRVDPAGKWLDVSDPSYGRERWPAAGIEYIWDGYALTLVRGTAR